MIANQVYVFLWTIITGAIMGLIFDAFRIFRKSFKSKDFFVFIQDILFWIVIAILLIVSAFLINDGELRGYMFLGYIFGILFYMLAFSKIVISVATFIINFFTNLVKKIMQPIIKIFKLLFKKICKSWGVLRKNVQKVRNKVSFKENFVKKSNN